MPVLHLKQKNAWCLSLARLRWEVKASWYVNYFISALNLAIDKECTDTDKADLVESPITRIFGGKFRSPILAPNQPDPVPTEGWRSLHLDIQVRDSFFLLRMGVLPVMTNL
jgi:hypothetical protein